MREDREKSQSLMVKQDSLSTRYDKNLIQFSSFNPILHVYIHKKKSSPGNKYGFSSIMATDTLEGEDKKGHCDSKQPRYLLPSQMT